MNLRAVPALLLSVLTVLAVLAAGVTGLPFVASPIEGVPVAAPVVPSAGGHVCITGADEVDPGVELLLLAAPDEDPDSAGARGVLLTLGRDAERRALGPIAPGALERREVELGAAGWTWIGWADRPLAAWQEWRTQGAPGQPRGVVASTCLPTDAATQTVLGLRTDGGFEALLRLANPFEADATFAVTFVTTTGVIEPVALRNVSVAAGERLSVRLNDHVPEQSDIAAIVSVGAGRLAVEGLQRSIAAVGDAEGVAALPPVTSVSTTWTFPWLPVGPDTDGAVWVLNPEPRPVVVGLTLHTAQGASVPFEDSIELPAGALVRLATADLAADGVRTFGLTVRSETSGILAAAGGTYLAVDPARSGLVGLAGAPRPDAEWSVAGAVLTGRDTALHVVNLDEVAAAPRVVLTVLQRDTAPGDAAAEGTVDERQVTVVIESRPLAPGATLRIPLPLDGAHAFSAVVDGGRALVVSRTTFGREALEPVALAATPSSAWRRSERPLAGRSVTGWVASLDAGRAGTDTDGPPRR